MFSAVKLLNKECIFRDMGKKKKKRTTSCYPKNLVFQVFCVSVALYNAIFVVK